MKKQIVEPELLCVSLCFTLLCLMSAKLANADVKKFDLSAKLYTKWLYRNDDTQGVLWLGNPFWPDDIAGNNGVATEFELIFLGKVSKKVEAGARLKTRFGGMWHDWWESGERKWEYQGQENTSGDSLGMNRAMYVKFRGFYVRLTSPLPYLDWVKIGASNLGMFNAWTIGKVRYIDRDNARGVFIHGGPGQELFKFDIAIIALPKLWVGPNWSTGIGDDKIDYPFYTQDWAYGIKLFTSPMEWIRLTWIASYTRDVEFDKWDPDAKGSATAGCKDAMGNSIPGCTMDHAVGTYPRFLNGVTTLQVELQPTDSLYVSILGGYSQAEIGKDYAANGVKENDGMFPVLYKDASDYSAKLDLFLEDPFDVGLSLKLEGFYIGQDWTSIFAARREDDVLLTDGFIEGGQLPTLNLANEFIDFDEPWFESCIGWQGATVVPAYEIGGFEIAAEFTYLSYNTNNRDDPDGRDVDQVYPTFLYSEGYTDTDLYDYANIGDRGRDPRNVYRRYQDRLTFITVTKASYVFDSGLKLEAKFKYIRDDDWRQYKRNGKLYPDDDYLGNIYIARGVVSVPLWSVLRLGIGAQYDYWDEKNREGNPTMGYGNYLTKKYKGFLALAYNFWGARLTYYLEYVHKNQYRPEELNLDDQFWRVWRSKATLEVAW